jgi:hypothetical protein
MTTDATTTAPTTEPKTDRLVGLGGWLILVGFGLCVAPFRIMATMAENLKALDADTWAALTTPGGPAYHPLWVPVLAGEVILNLGLLGLSVVTAVMFFKKRRAFPSLAIAFLAAGVGVQILDLAAVQLIPFAAAQVGASEVRELVKAGLGAAIWIPYLLHSKRVHATFVQ